MRVKTPEANSDQRGKPFQSAFSVEPTPSQHLQFLRLQRAYGNRAVQQSLCNVVIQRCGGCGPAKDDRVSTPVAESGLTISEPGDQYEREADRVAEEVIRMPIAAFAPGPDDDGNEQLPIDGDMPLPGEEEVQSPKPFSAGGNRILRKCSQCSGLEDESEINRRSAHASAPVAGSVEAVLQRQGSPLERPVRDYFEPRFGRIFDNVRIHTGTEADESARSVNALAYTVGSNLVFGAGQYRPDTPEGKRLIAHELTHVVQQGAAVALAPSVTALGRPPQVLDMEAGGMIQRWSIGDPNPGVNTIVCDGAGGITTQLGATGNATQTTCLRDCMETHEQSHKSDALAANATICKDVTRGKLVMVDGGAQQKATEIKASNAEISCLQGKQPTANDTCKPIIAARITQMEGYRDSFK